MKKSILNIGKTLNKAEQKDVLGGGLGFGDECTNPSMNPCDPFAGQFLGNPACNINEICVYFGPGTASTSGRCVCPD